MSVTLGADVALADRSLRLIRDGQRPSGALLASPTFAQYRYSWFRDGAFVCEAMDRYGRLDVSARFHAWAAHTIAAESQGLARATEVAMSGGTPDPGDYLHCRYAEDGQRAESGGHGDTSWPTFQLDGPAIWLWSLEHHRRHGGDVEGSVRDVVPITARYIAAMWETPCFDAWEESGDRVHTSTVAAIAAGLDAASSLEPSLQADALIRGARDAIGRWLADGSGPYVKWQGSDQLDASLLWMAVPYGLATITDDRFAATLQGIERNLTSQGGGVHRYATDTFYGGGAWPVLTAAHARVLLWRDEPGDFERARSALDWIEATADEAGQLPEQVSDHALAPDHVDDWQRDWGSCARPLLWSHAAYLSLRADLVMAGMEASPGALT